MTARGLRIVPDRAQDAPRCSVVFESTPAGAAADGRTARRQLPNGDGDWAEPVSTGSAPGQRLAEPTAPARPAPTAEEREWTAQAVCATADPDLLFVTGAAQREVAKLCRDCPVQMQCLADALDNQIEFGVWGGLTERQRRALLKRRPDVVSWRMVLEQARAEATSVVAS